MCCVVVVFVVFLRITYQILYVLFCIRCRSDDIKKYFFEKRLLLLLIFLNQDSLLTAMNRLLHE